MRDIGKNIKKIRSAKGMSQEELAKALYVTRQTVSNYENSRSKPDIDMLMKIAEILGTDVTMLIYGPKDAMDHKTEYRRLAIAVLITALFAILWAYCNQLDWIGLQIPIMLKYLINLIVPPITMLTGGWSLLQLLEIKMQIRRLSEQSRKRGRLILFLLLGCFIVIPLPQTIWMIVVVVRSFLYSSVQMTFPYIPVYTPISMGMFKIIFQMPFVFAILGGAFWLVEIPFRRND